MNDETLEFNKQLELDVLVNGLTEITMYYVDKFDRYDFTEVVIPEGIKSIGKNAFDECWEITSVTIPDTLTNIGNDAFIYCSGLKNITIPNSVTSIGSSAFAFCSGLTSITIGKGITKIGFDTFYSCKRLTNITFEGKTLDEVRFMKDYPWGILNPKKVINVHVG